MTSFKRAQTNKTLRHELFVAFIQIFHRPFKYYEKEIVTKQEKMNNKTKNLNQPMETNKLKEAILEKNNLLAQQAKRIKLLEDKMTTLRRKYFHLKYASIMLH